MPGSWHSLHSCTWRDQRHFRARRGGCPCDTAGSCAFFYRHLWPRTPWASAVSEQLAQTGGTLVVIMGVKNSRSIANALLAGGRSADTPAAVIQEGTTSEERTFRCTLSTLADVIEHESIKPPAVYVIGEVADL